MATTHPIKHRSDIQKLKAYFIQKGQFRNYAMTIMGLNTSLRIGDLLRLQWQDVYSFQKKAFREHVMLTEQKTGKHNMIALNNEVMSALDLFMEHLGTIESDDYIFQSRKGTNAPIGRVAAYRIIKNAVTELHLEGNISCHSMRKTFGYHAWKQGVPPAVIMSIYNHSSIEITKRYLSIDQDDKDEVFRQIRL